MSHSAWRAIVAVLALCASVANAAPILFGVNIHVDDSSVELNAQRAAVLMQRNIRSARIGIVDHWGDTALRRDQAARIVANGGVVQASIFPAFTEDRSCSPDLSGIEKRAYLETQAAVNKVKDVIHDFELMNENPLRPEVAKEVPPDSAGASTSSYEGKPCVASLAAALRGMSRAIVGIRASSGLPLRIILGTVGRDWGFLAYMQRQGVQFDVIGWHIYPWAVHESLLTDTSFGPGGPLSQLARFGKPVHVNEFNCGDITRPGYENEPGRPVTESCLKAFARHLRELTAQKLVNIESVHVYELVDEPRKRPPEDRFGLMYDLSRDKPLMYLYMAFAGGDLTAEQRREITRRALMTDAEIDSRKAEQDRDAARRAALRRTAGRP